ncbi:hypothetical protein FGIG_12096 [Fasciola gigantica]|uniref:DUF5738 domain-containing protein n=1 Tax=Fasciola gigantica TaxID=46835 RepID=A0A504YDS0_FASGI|nr:hypothetical protein FGIG_12096 [Fasciola gigantica]
MASIRDSLNIAAPISHEFSTSLNPHVPFRPLALSRAPTPALLGSNNQCGSALATEIDSYRRRIQTLLHFFDCIAQHWWDHLYPYKRDLIKRPSRSADEIRSYRTRLVARLNKFTMRTVAPAAAAIAMMEAHASVKVLPPNLLSPISTDLITMDVPMTGDNGAALLNKACALARRIGDIEKLKQRLIMAALTWITSDGRDFTLRTQRIALLARHAEPCLIEHYSGVRALLTHYYRPRVLTQRTTGSHGTAYGSAKTNPALRAEPITAARLTTTNEQITSAIRQAYPRVQVGLIRSVDSGDRPEELQSAADNTQQQSNLEYLGHTDDMFTSLSSSMGITQNSTSLTGNSSQVPMLPSIVLNPLSIDTSQLDWLSYEINQREFNLYIINSEEPEEGPMYRRESSVFTPIHRVTLAEDSASASITTGTKSTRSRRSGTAGITTRETRTRSPVEIGYRTLSTPIAISSLKDQGWSASSHESEVSAADITLTSFTDQKLDETHRVEENVVGMVLKPLHSAEALPESRLTQTPLTAQGEGTVTPSVISGHVQSEMSMKDSPASSEGLQLVAGTLTGKGEEPNGQAQPDTDPITYMQEIDNAMRPRTNVHWRSDQKQSTRNQTQGTSQKAKHSRVFPTVKELKPSSGTNQIAPRHSVDTKHRNQIPIRTQLSNGQDTKQPR